MHRYIAMVIKVGLSRYRDQVLLPDLRLAYVIAYFTINDQSESLIEPRTRLRMDENLKTCSFQSEAQV